MSIASEASCAAALQQLMRDWDIYDALTLQTVLEMDAGFARALAPALWLLLQEAGPSRSSTGTMTDVTDTRTTQSVGTQAAVAADDMVDVATAEAMVKEALCMVAEAEAVAASLVNVAEVAERRASKLESAL
eukprot:7388185-Prymnesium_polylepis.1